jgi:succinyl-CoA synthetase beta subunit
MKVQANRWSLAITIDRERYCPTILVSHRDQSGKNSHGSTKAQAFPFRFSNGITRNLVANVSTGLDLSPAESESLGETLTGLYRVFAEKDATLISVDFPNSKSAGSWICSNPSLVIDDAASKRQTDLFALRDPEDEVAEEVEAEQYGLVYIRMDGNIGNVVNGAGLAMATNDAIGLYGGASANFLDAGGQATKDTMIQAFRIILKDERVKVIIVNIYGGLTIYI